jgi:hypothetical protein
LFKYSVKKIRQKFAIGNLLLSSPLFRLTAPKCNPLWHLSIDHLGSISPTFYAKQKEAGAFGEKLLFNLTNDTMTKISIRILPKFCVHLICQIEFEIKSVKLLRTKKSGKNVDEIDSYYFQGYIFLQLIHISGWIIKSYLPAFLKKPSFVDAF